MKKTIGIILIIVAIILFCAGGIQIKAGFDKKDNYYNSEISYSLNKNAYVGGDAYNYIINGNYFTGYLVFGSALLIMGMMGTISGLSFILSENKDILTGKDSEPNNIQLPPL